MTTGGNNLKSKLSNAGNKFMFFMAIEQFKPQIIKGIKEGLKDVTPEKFTGMVDKGEFFHIPERYLKEVVGYEKQARWIKAGQLAEMLAEARPDLAEVLISKGSFGGVWLINLHKYLLDTVLTAHEKVTDTSKEEMINVTCDKCGQSFPYLKKDISKLKECPLCKAPATDGPAPALPEKPLPQPPQST